LSTGNGFRKSGVTGAICAVALLLAAAPAAADTFAVTNGDDTSGAGSLRSAIESAEANDNEPTVDQIPITFTGNIDVLTYLPEIDEPVTITGPGASSLHVRRSPSALTNFTLFFVRPAAGSTVTIRDLTITGARAANQSGAGIGKSGLGALIIDSVVLSDNETTGAGSGAAISYDQGFTSIRNSTLTDNEADFGGAIIGGENGGFGGEAELVNSTVTGNRARSFGGGVYVNGLGEIEILSSTIQGNTADSDDTSGGDGGGITTGDDSGINLANTLLAGNAVGVDNPIAEQCNTPVDSFGYNLSATDDSLAGCSGFTATGDTVSGNAAMLGSLAANGGPTPTIALLSGNPGIDAGNPATLGGAFPACPASDQRGLSRGGSNGPCDIGAFEVQVPVTPTAPASPASTVTGLRAKAIKKCKKVPKGPKRKKCIKRAKRLPV
jgi:hypothetical protein